MGELGQMSAAEMDMWMVRASFEPFLAKRIDTGFAHIAMWLHNINTKKGKQKPLQDFLLFRTPEPEGDLDDKILTAFSGFIKKPKAEK